MYLQPKTFIPELGINKVAIKMSKTSLVVSSSKKEGVGVDTDSEISKGLKRKIQIANEAITSAEEKVKVAYEYAIKVDKLKPREAAKVLFDRLTYSPQWIRKHLPDEAKNMIKSRLVQPKRKNVGLKAHIITPPRVSVIDATILPKDGEEDAVDRVQIKTLALTVTKGHVKKFYDDILKIRDRAEKHGLKINSDLTVEVLS